MQHKIQMISEKKLVGVSLTMSHVANRTGDLWRSFMPRRKEIKNAINSELISLQIYGADYFQKFHPESEFTKWACVWVSQFDDIPQGMSTLVVPPSLYAIFHHKGSSTDMSTFQYIFSQWLPTSEFELDNRPHFEVLGEKYKNNDPSSEEDIYIPVRPRQ